MKCSVPMKYFGRNSKNEPIIDFKNSGRVVYGVMANLEAVVMIACKIYYDSLRIDILEEWYSKRLDINEAEKRYSNLIEKYNPSELGGRKIQVFGNDIGNKICKLPLAQPDDSEGYEIIDINPESLIFSVQCRLNYLKFAGKQLKESWHDELKNFNLISFRNNEQSYNRLIALANIIDGANTCTNFILTKIPDRIILDTCYHDNIKLFLVEAKDFSDSSHKNYNDYYQSQDGRHFLHSHGTRSENHSKIIRFDEWNEIEKIP
ncbi:MAG: hypothetical protein AAFR83_11710 [Cyanobacteria bacterium J06629_18]